MKESKSREINRHRNKCLMNGDECCLFEYFVDTKEEK